MKVISTEYSQMLAARIAKQGSMDIVEVKFSRFPDGEHYLRTGPVDKDMVVVGSVVNSDSLVQLLLLIDACAGSRLTLLLPYMGYARQDKQFHQGEPLSARAVARVLSLGVSRVITVNIHDPGVLSHFSIPAVNLSLAHDIGMYLSAIGYTDPLILAPDDGATGFASVVAAAGGWECDYLEKTRISGDEVRFKPKTLYAEGRDVVMVDDIISTGGTLATATRLLYEQGARTVAAACVHGIFAGGALSHLIASGIRDVYASDTIEGGCSVYSAAGTVVSGLSRC
jgi:ribose-phosphate pyrophosphokinase